MKRAEEVNEVNKPGKNITKNIRDKAYEFIQESGDDGIRHSELYAKIKRIYPSYKDKVIQSQISDLPKLAEYRGKIEHEPYGPFRAKLSSSGRKETEKKVKKTLNEEAFYQPFAEYVEENLKECTLVKVLGGHMLRKKWATPDIAGYFKVGSAESFSREPEILVGELKISNSYNDFITAFGQAMAYTVYAHKVYIAIPETGDPDGLDLIESLCVLYGIGLLLFEPKDPDNPNFALRNRAQRHEPDIEYLNVYGSEIVKFLEKR